jgi:hypothetical protein
MEQKKKAFPIVEILLNILHCDKTDKGVYAHMPLRQNNGILTY